MSLARRKQAVVSAVFALFLLWRAVVTVGALGHEISRAGSRPLLEAWTLSEEARIRRGLSLWESRLAVPRGDLVAAWEALRERTPEDARVTVVTARRDGMPAASSFLATLTFPRRFDWIEALPSETPAMAPELRERFYLLALDPGWEETLARACDLLEQRSSWSLWRLRR